MAKKEPIATPKFQLTKKQQAWIDEGVQCSIDKKAAETRLEELKEALENVPKGTHVTSNGGVLIVGMKDYYYPPDPELFLATLKKEKREGLFAKCVTVVQKSCDAILGDKTFEKLRTFNKSGKSFSFK